MRSSVGRTLHASKWTPRRGYLHRGPSADGSSHALSQEDDLVFLNIYNLGKSNAVQSLNGLFKTVGIGAFHCAIQVFGTEWSYGGWPEESPCDPNDTGVWSCLPRMSVSHTFQEAVLMGSLSISEEETVELICSLMQEWPMSEYDILNKNCCHFCEELCELLGVGPLPSRVKKLAGLGSTLNESASMMAEAASKVKADIVGVGVVASSLV
ncbi:DESI2, partial [Symbiodinium pilosum]